MCVATTREDTTHQARVEGDMAHRRMTTDPIHAYCGTPREDVATEKTTKGMEASFTRDNDEETTLIVKNSKNLRQKVSVQRHRREKGRKVVGLRPGKP
jgi:hypothetical protein